jgi:hypothetical protein
MKGYFLTMAMSGKILGKNISILGKNLLKELTNKKQCVDEEEGLATPIKITLEMEEDPYVDKVEIVVKEARTETASRKHESSWQQETNTQFHGKSCNGDPTMTREGNKQKMTNGYTRLPSTTRKMTSITRGRGGPSSSKAAFQFFDSRYSTDHLLTNTFRHIYSGP